MRNLISTSLAHVLLGGVFALTACGKNDPNPQQPTPTSGTDGNTGNGLDSMSNPGDAGTKALGDTCTDNGECKSRICKEITYPDGIGGKTTEKTCAQCSDNSQCTDPDTGNLCVPSLGGDANAAYFACGKGELGGGCEGDQHCGEGRLCSEIGAGITTCGQCKTDAECTDPAANKCLVNTEDILKSHRYCSAPAADGIRCSGDEDSDSECANYCAPIPGLPISVGVCGPCKEDAHCGANQKCNPPTITQDLEFIASECQDKPADPSTTGDDSTTDAGTTDASTTDASTTDGTTDGTTTDATKTDGASGDAFFGADLTG